VSSFVFGGLDEPLVADINHPDVAIATETVDRPVLMDLQQQESDRERGEVIDRVTSSTGS
jgi:hypothetical protein